MSFSETKGKRAALYARFSSDMQKETSIRDQYASLERTAARLGFVLDKKHYYKDEAASGASMFERPGLTVGLFGAMDRREFDVILVEATDRLSREPRDLYDIFSRAEHFDVEIFTSAGGVKVSDVQLMVDSYMNKDFLKKLAIRVKRGHDGAAREGRIATSLAYGYDTVFGRPGERVINEKEAEAVLLFFTSYANGKTPSQISDLFEARGILSPSGEKRWNPSTFVGGLNKRGMIHNRLYVGEYVKNQTYNVKSRSTGKPIGRKTKDPDGIIRVQLPHLRIISDELWEAAHRVRELRGNRQRGGAPIRSYGARTRGDYLLAGIVRCSECMGDMTVMFVDKSGRGYRVSCSNARNKGTCTHKKSYYLDELTKGALEQMRFALTDPEFLKAQAKDKIREMERITREKDGERVEVESKLNRIKVQLPKMAAELFELDGEARDLVREMMKQKEAERAALAERLKLLGAGTNVRHLEPLAIAHFSRNVDTLATRLLAGEVDAETRHALQMVLDSVLVHPTPSRAKYEISLYARLTAVSEGIDIFPKQRPIEQVIEEEHIPSIASTGLELKLPSPATDEMPDMSFAADGLYSSRPPSSRRSTGW